MSEFENLIEKDPEDLTQGEVKKLVKLIKTETGKDSLTYLLMLNIIMTHRSLQGAKKTIQLLEKIETNTRPP